MSNRRKIQEEVPHCARSSERLGQLWGRITDYLNAVLVAKLLSLLCGHLRTSFCRLACHIVGNETYLPTALRRFYTCHDVCRVQIRIFRTFTWWNRFRLSISVGSFSCVARVLWCWTEIIDVPLGFRRPRWILVNVTFVSDLRATNYLMPTIPVCLWKRTIKTGGRSGGPWVVTWFSWFWHSDTETQKHRK